MLESALADVIESWDPSRDIKATILLIKMSGHVDCRRAARALGCLLAKPVSASPSDARELSDAIAFFARIHATGNEALNLAYKLRDAHLGSSAALASLLARAAEDRRTAIVQDLRILVPEVIDKALAFEEPEELRRIARIKRYFANSLVDILGAPAAFMLALEAQIAGEPSLREAIELFTLQGRTIANDTIVLRDKRTRAESTLDVGNIDEEILKTSGAIAVNDNLTGETSIDDVIGKPDNE